ncbi:MAG: hypothetical protein F4039_07305 [Gammaproteobacteria bacterium]|nr:hypothetical protein [Gammaproteobacteria bacterium]MYK43876.1 hypothetical protein [Gammaproteobacteria bacterium]
MTQDNYKDNSQKCGFTESQILARRVNQSDSDTSKIKVRCPNTAGHKNDDQNPSAIYNQDTGFLHCFVCGQLGFADDRDNPDHVRNTAQKTGRSIEQQADIEYSRYEIGVREIEFERSYEFKICDLFCLVNTGEVVCHNGKWMVCNALTGHWTPGQDEVYRRVKKAADVLLRSIPEEDQKERMKLHNKIEHNHILQAALIGASKSFSISTEGRDVQFDEQPHLLGVPSGVVDLKTGEIRPAHWAEYISKFVRVEPAEGEHSTFDNLLRQISGGNFEVEQWLLKFLGYCLTGETVEEINLFLQSQPAAGKTTLGEILRYVLGGYCVVINSDDVIESKHAQHSQWLSRTEGGRLGVVSEVPENCRWNTRQLNRLFSGESITARAMRQNDRTFDSKLKCLIYGNHQPSFGANDGLTRKLKLLQLRTIPEDQRDVDMKTKLEAEAPAILNTLIEYAGTWYAGRDLRLTVPKSMVLATEKYVIEQDSVAQFIKAKVKECRSNHVLAKNVFEAYQSFCEEEGLRPLGRNKFHKEMDLKGCESERTMDGKTYRNIEVA